MDAKEFCPKCGSAVRLVCHNGGGTEFECLSFQPTTGEFYQHKECVSAERDALLNEKGGE